MRLGDFTASIIVDGKALEEYDVTSESTTKVICWVASEEGKSFGVQWKCHEESRVVDARGVVSVDGVPCESKFIRSGPLGVGDTKTLSHFIGATSLWDLMFALVELSDDDSLMDKEIHKNLGEISLVIDRGKRVKERHFGINRTTSEPGQNKRLHERSKKAIVHCVGLGPETAMGYSPYRSRFTRNGQPGITFVFKYRPLGVLQANGIAPRITSTDASASHENSRADHNTGGPNGSASEDIKPAHLDDHIKSLENELKRLRELQGRHAEDQKPKRIKIEDGGGTETFIHPWGDHRSHVVFWSF